MKLACRRCGSSRLIFITQQRCGGIHGAICACCRKPLVALDWNVDLQPDSNTHRQDYPDQNSPMNGVIFNEADSEQ